MEDGFIPLSEFALSVHATRERVIRRILSGTIRGRLVAGRWLVLASDVAVFGRGRPQDLVTTDTPTA